MKDFFGKEFDALSQMNALIRKLALAGIPFEVRGFPSTSECMMGTLQICAPTIKKPAIDIVCHGSSYGHEGGLMEAMAHGSYAEKHGWGDDVCGWLDVDEAFKLVADVITSLHGEAAE